MNTYKSYKAKILSVVLTIMMTVTFIPVSMMVQTGYAKATTTPSNPMVTGDSTTWDCVYFGSYPQTEVVAKASQCGTYGNEYWGKTSDYIEDSALYSKLQRASYDSNGDTIIGGTKYIRIRKGDATCTSDNGSPITYYWSDSSTYHYFRYEPIKWRVLEVSDGYAMLLADKALDDQRYNTSDTNITWESCTIRSWLNGYSALANSYGTDYTSKNFIDSAFSAAEQSAIKTANLENADNINEGTEGGNNTSDKVFLLSESDVWSCMMKDYQYEFERK